MAASPYRRLGQLEQQAHGDAASFPSSPTAGGGHHDNSTGAHIVPATKDWFWAEVQPVADPEADPEDDECSLRHEWSQVVPIEGGCWDIPEYGLSGTTDANPAFEENGVAVTDDAVIVRMRRGATKLDDDGLLQQEYLFALTQPGTASTSSRHCRVWAAKVSSGGIDYYPAKFNKLEAGGWNEGPLVGDTYDCWLVQRFNFPLSVGSGSGGGCYTAKPAGFDKTLTSGSEYTLPVYTTTEYPTLGEDCEIVN